MSSPVQVPTNPQTRKTDLSAVYRLIYRSRSNIEGVDADRELGEILRVARSANAAKGITGALLLYDRWFAQVLEGDEHAVRKLFTSIKSDPRHGSVELKQEGQVPARAFGRWAMANVGEHGSPDGPLVATSIGTTEAASWRLDEAQEKLVAVLRDLTRGYGLGS